MKSHIMQYDTATTGKNSYYPDILIFVVAIPIISAINFHLTYSNIQLNGYYLLRFFIDTAQGYLAWWVVRVLIIYLDQRFSYERKPLKRILVQTVLTTITGLLVIAITTEILSLLIKNEWAPLHFYTKDLLIISIWFLVINGFYIGLYLYRQWNENIEQAVRTKLAPIGIPIKTGNQNLLVRFEEILLFVVDSEYVQLIDRTGKKYLMDLSLDKVEKKVPTAVFFRLNRQILAHKQVIRGFKKIENGKLLIHLTTPIDFLQDLTVSRTKAASFRSWFLPQ